MATFETVVDLLNRVYEGATDPKRTLLSVSCADPLKQPA